MCLFISFVFKNSIVLFTSAYHLTSTGWNASNFRYIQYLMRKYFELEVEHFCKLNLRMSFGLYLNSRQLKPSNLVCEHVKIYTVT